MNNLMMEITPEHPSRIEVCPVCKDKDTLAGINCEYCYGMRFIKICQAPLHEINGFLREQKKKQPKGGTVSL